ncbi:ribosome small subunit-dependent GTPase A [Ferruginibacter paludis]|uniref:ribosome small subunit-dependent GTPase A n=1 Tax=Ferruginibacter paludis TaxID=1310417 RepID=UPI0025B62304|nr:ribosome small subunit-dependent GTPase A [Ferruginibacter paludis]MDN3658973.1 ribosome small subunit-dependent GTPase A [Ferruginibacter paludis]
MKATVYKSTGSWYVVQSEEGTVLNARILGKFKMDGLTSTNPIAVGDVVTIVAENELEGSVTITEIEDRKNYITRTSPANKHKHHIIASNIDQSLLFATLKEPKTSQGFIDRFLITSEAYRIPSIIVFNKADLYKEKETEKFAELKSIYETIGYKVMGMSIEKNIGVDEVKNLLKDKTTLLSGHSGVGKSSFINTIFPELQLKTQDVSGWSGKGLHTTTFAEMFNLPFGGRVIDTPGIRELGLVDIPKQELSHYFPEMWELINDCQFNNCMHTNEPGCAVKAAVEEGVIHMDRYISYCTILDKIEEKSY